MADVLIVINWIVGRTLTAKAYRGAGTLVDSDNMTADGSITTRYSVTLNNIADGDDIVIWDSLVTAAPIAQKTYKEEVVADRQLALLKQILNKNSEEIHPYHLVKCAPYTVGNAGVGWGGHYAADVVWNHILTYFHGTRIRQSGTIRRVIFTCDNMTLLTSFKITVWRRRADGSGNFDLIGMSENLLSKMAVGSNDLTFDNPIAGVEEGDYYGTYAAWSEHPTGGNFTSNYPTGSAPYAEYGTYIHDSRTADPGITNVNFVTDYDWRTTTFFVVQLYIEPPDIVCLGDSIVSGISETGVSGHGSYLEYDASYIFDKKIASIPYSVGHLLGMTYQNMGKATQTTTNIKDRITTDCVTLKPKYAVIDGGHNDYTGLTDPTQLAAATATILANYETILIALTVAGIKPVIMGITPRLITHGGSTAIMQQVDIADAGLLDLANDYDGLFVDTMKAVGQFRSGGDTGNLWDIQTRYNGDGLHFSMAGYIRMAQELAWEIARNEIRISTDANGRVDVGKVLGETADIAGLASVIEGTITLKQALSLFLAILTGKSSGGGTPTITFKNTADTKDRLVVTVNAKGDRTAIITRDGT